MRYVIDTTLVIDYATGHPAALAMVERLFAESSELYVCAPVVAEALSRGEPEEVAAVEALLRALEYVSDHPEAARWAGASRRRLRRTSPRQLGDALIAAVAWSLDATVVTRNPADFEVQGVDVLAYG